MKCIEIWADNGTNNFDEIIEFHKSSEPNCLDMCLKDDCGKLIIKTVELDDLRLVSEFYQKVFNNTN